MRKKQISFKDWQNNFIFTSILFSGIFFLLFAFVYGYHLFQETTQKVLLVLENSSNLVRQAVITHDRSLLEISVLQGLNNLKADFFAICDNKQLISFQGHYVAYNICENSGGLSLYPATMTYYFSIPQVFPYHIVTSINLFHYFNQMIPVLIFAALTLLLYFYFFKFFLQKVNQDLFHPINNFFNNQEQQNLRIYDLKTIFDERKMKDELQQQLVLQQFEIKSSQRFAHDMASPLNSLDHLLHEISIQDPETRDLVEISIHHLKAMYQNLLLKTVKDKVSQDNQQKWPKERSINVMKLVDEVIKLKKIEFKELRYLYFQIENKIDRSPLIFFPEIELRRILSNVINNAVETIDVNGDGLISLTLQQNQNFVELIVKDRGKGIPQEILEKIISQEVSHGKKNGHGIGLVSARNMLEQFKGKLKIESCLNQGSKVSIQLKIFPGIVHIEDDDLVRRMWKREMKNQGVDLVSFSSPDEFLNEWQHFSLDIIIFSDINFANSKLSGWDLFF